MPKPPPARPVEVIFSDSSHLCHTCRMQAPFSSPRPREHHHRWRCHRSMHGLTYHCCISPLSSSIPSFLWLQHQKYGDLPIIYFALARQIPNMFVSAAARTARNSQTTLTKACFVKPHPKLI